MCSAQPEILKLIDDLITLAQCTQEQLEDLMSTEEMFVGYQRKGRLLLKQFLEAERCFFPILFNIPKQRFEHRLVDFRGEEWDEITGDAPPNVELIYWDAGSGESERSRRFSDNVRLYVWGRETIERNISMSWLTFDPIKALKNCIRGLSQLRRRVPEVCDLVLAKSVAKELSSVATGRTAPGSEERVFKREGDYWQIDYEGKSVQLKNSKGLQYISWLLRFSGEYLDALTIIDLVEERQLPNASRFLSGLAEDQLAHLGLSRTDLSDPIPLTDAKARRHCEIQIQVITERLASERFSSSDEKIDLEENLKTIKKYLAAASGLGGRPRGYSSAPDRARVSVKNGITAALKKIEKSNTPLSRHLMKSIRTGTQCVYLPDPPVNWEV